jgi:hypothetical protein
MNEEHELRRILIIPIGNVLSFDQLIKSVTKI